jgi:hypothetical protein
MLSEEGDRLRGEVIPRKAVSHMPVEILRHRPAAELRVPGGISGRFMPPPLSPSCLRLFLRKNPSHGPAFDKAGHSGSRTAPRRTTKERSRHGIPTRSRSGFPRFGNMIQATLDHDLTAFPGQKGAGAMRVKRAILSRGVVAAPRLGCVHQSLTRSRMSAGVGAELGIPPASRRGDTSQRCFVIRSVKKRPRLSLSAGPVLSPLWRIFPARPQTQPKPTQSKAGDSCPEQSRIPKDSCGDEQDHSQRKH